MEVEERLYQMIVTLPEKCAGTCCGFKHSASQTCEETKSIAERFGYTEIVTYKELTDGTQGLL